MITNERQHRITKTQVERFKTALRDFDELELAKQGIDPVIIAAQRTALQQQLAELEADVAAYESLRSGRVKRLFPSGITDIGEKLIEARISQGLSQKALADRLGMKEQQVQRYEQERYLTANLMRVAEIAEALHLDLFAFFEAREATLLDKIAPNLKGYKNFDFTKLPVKEMKERGWLQQIRVPLMESVTDAELAAAFVSQAFQDRPAPSLHKQHVRIGGKQDHYALLAWKARVLHKARRASSVGSQLLDAYAVQELVHLSASPDGPVKAVRFMRDHGVIVVFERHLASTHLDGAAMLLDSIPVIGLTLRFDRLDNFWFVLLHESAHIVLHRERGLNDGFFDEDQAALDAVVEKEADDFAQSAFIPQEMWKRSFVRFTSAPKEVQKFAFERNLGAAVVAGRIRKERNDYTLFNELVGFGTVRKQLADAGYWEG